MDTRRRLLRQRSPNAAQVAAVGVVATLVVCLIACGKIANYRSPDTFYDAIRRGDAGTVRRILALGADPNQVVGRNALPLEAAIGLNQMEIVGLLLNAGAEPNRLDRTTAPLHIAAMFDRPEAIERIEGGKRERSKKKR